MQKNVLIGGKAHQSKSKKRDRRWEEDEVAEGGGIGMQKEKK
jgi:hypothetical protein